MIARAQMPEDYLQWNAHWGAPFGRRYLQWMPIGLRWRRPVRPWVGMFAFQTNNTTREFEYPWSFHATPLQPGMHALEIGGSLSGFQFVLSKNGINVVNLDPGENARGKGWPLSPEAHGALNRAFHTDVRLKHCFIEQADFQNDSFDRAFAISVFEHIPSNDLTSLMKHIYRVLRPDGILIATIDLFLNVSPFTENFSNEYGTNIDVHSLLNQSGFELISGNKSELLGFAEFDCKDIKRRAHAGQFFRGDYPALVQCLTCRKI